MLTELKFVVGAVGKKDLLAEMTHFKIQGGFVQSFNGSMALRSPIAFDIDCMPKAAPLIKAIGLCEDSIVLSLTDAGKLRVSSGPFKAFIDCLDVSADTVHVTPAGHRLDFNGEALLNAFKVLAGFMGTDASRMWTNGILLRDKSAFATNNVCLVEVWLGTPFPVTVNIPRQAVIEVLRINEPPTYAQTDGNSITFHFSGQRWLRTQLYETEWPNLARILDNPSQPVALPAKLFEALEYLAPFTDERGLVYLGDGVVSTHLDLDMGASFQLEGSALRGCFKLESLRLLEGVATMADFNRVPAPALFFGDKLRGAITGFTS